MEQWKKFLTESSDWRSEDYTDPMLARKTAALLARKIVDEAGDNWSWLGDVYKRQIRLEIRSLPRDQAMEQSAQKELTPLHFLK